MPYTNETFASRISEIKAELPAQISSRTRHPPDAGSVAQLIDHTQLSLSATGSQIDTLCDEAIKYNFATVCVRRNYVSRAAQNLKGAPPRVACVVGFHEGTHPTDEKVAEAKEAVQYGASELDMVLNYHLLREKRYADVFDDIHAVRLAAKDIVLKVILETSQLSEDEIVAGCVISITAGADYVKTSTGFKGPGARVENVALMSAVCGIMGGRTKVKASGGIRTAEDCVRMIRAGAERIGASAGVQIVNELLHGKREAEEESKSTDY
ncbi:deoxyribose-phosphate aldolase [Uncinocarpus reesii 1704]|uniref:deoxyribose-phosphate aldolase n=1 Tax=Uncinocarpus reesii (strain UAMH 1704) TaxID=336963 RepID=C4JE80_UNCRE|nr:deoxyribose-phosphate aldolase [Uncinocarpus reesii 1704]EEP75658.1 deoxyribose-phosphate aldolase [Uncinocarpus reesii 1704]